MSTPAAARSFASRATGCRAGPIKCRAQSFAHAVRGFFLLCLTQCLNPPCPRMHGAGYPNPRNFPSFAVKVRVVTPLVWSKSTASRAKIASGHVSGNGIKFTNIMGDYKGRVNLRHRKRRFTKNQRIKALAATKKEITPPPGAAEQGTA